jgi:ABC-2 type transport system ATP-binding protein
LTGREVLLLAAGLAGVVGPAERADRVLAEAGLAAAAARRVGGYSRGMLQRLGLAATLVGEPELLLLDEPASALDPAGRREVLDLIAHLRGRTTVILSSHILSDVQEVCDTVGILRAGRLLFQGPLDSLLVGHAVPAYRLHLASAVRPVAAALSTLDWVTGVREEAAAGRLRITVSSVAAAQAGLPGVLAGCGARLVSMAPEEPDLEHVFLELTS